VAEGARLESVYTARYPGFESLSLRHIPKISQRWTLKRSLKLKLKPVYEAFADLSGNLFVIRLKMPATGAVQFWLAISAT
jgi:hypothetical protein